MRFENPSMLNFLWLAILFGAFLYFSFKNRQNRLEKFVEAKLLTDVAKNADASKIIWKNYLIIVVIILTAMALARPQWGFEWREVKREGVDIIVAVDVSKSMLATDVKPNRLERTKLAIYDLVKKLKGDRIGLVAFAGNAFMVCPLTVDRNGFLLSLNELDTNTVSRGGTNIGSAVKEAMKSYDQTPSRYKAVVIITDGDNLEGDPLKMAHESKEKGIKIYTIGIGTPDGELIQIENDQGVKEFLKDSQGNFVKSRLNEKLLQDIAFETDGAYVRATGAEFGLDTIYENEISKFEKRELNAKMDKKYFERFQIPLSAALILLVVELCIPTRRKE